MSNSSELKTQPRLVLHLDQLDKNCRMIAAKANTKTIRIATKSIRSLPVLKRILSSSNVFQGFMCYNTLKRLCFCAKKGVISIAGYIKKQSFLKIREQLDPSGTFLNTYFAKLFEINNNRNKAKLPKSMFTEV